MSTGIERSLANARAIAEARNQALDNQLPLEVVQTVQFGADMDQLDHDTELEIKRAQEKEKRLAGLYGVVNYGFLQQSLETVWRNNGTNLFTEYPSGLTAEIWLAHRKNTCMVLPPEHVIKTGVKYPASTTSEQPPAIPTWILGAHPALDEQGRIHYEYLLATTKHIDPITGTNLELFVGTTDRVIESPIDEVPTAEEIHEDYYPEPKTFKLRYPRLPVAGKLTAAKTIENFSDDDMQLFQVSDHLMDLMCAYGALEATDKLIQEYSSARKIAHL